MSTATVRSGSLRQRVRRPSLRAHLVALVLLALVPVLVFSAGLVVAQARAERAAVENGLEDTARALAVAVDREVDGWITTLQALATSRDLEAGSLEAFHAQATRLLPTRSGWQAILLLDAEGRQLMNTLRPLGAPLPFSGDREAFREVVRTRRPTVGNMLVSRVTGDRIVGLGVPVLRGRALTAVLVGVFDIDAVGAVLGRQELPRSWTGVIVDGRGIVIARTGDGPPLGEPVAETLTAHVTAGDEGMFRDALVAGAPLYGAVSRAPVAGWSVVLGVPEATVQAGLLRALGWTLAGGAVFLVLGSTLAVLLGRRLARGIQSLADSAGALGHGATFERPGVPSVAEVERLGIALEQAGTLLEQRAAEREGLLAGAQAARAESDARADRLRVLAQLNQLVSSSLDMDALLEAIARSAAAIMDVPAVSFWTLEPATGELWLRAFSSPELREDFPYERLRAGDGVLGRIAAESVTIDVPDVFADEQVIAREWFVRHGLRSFYGLPITGPDGVLGVLSLNGRTALTFSAGDRETLQSFVAQAGVAIRNAQLYAEAQRGRHESDVVAELARTINASLDLDTILQAVADATRDVCDADTARIALVDPETGAMVIRYSAGDPAKAYPGFRIERGRGMGGLVWATGEPFRTSDFSAEARITDDDRDTVRADGVVVCMVVPIRIGARVEGLIYANNTRARAFTERDEHLVARLADHAAIGVRNARLLAAEQTARADAESANRGKDEFLAVLSHELRTPLTAMLGWVRMLRAGRLEPAQHARALETIERNTRLQSQLINDLLDVSRIVAGKLQLDSQAVDLLAVVDDTVESLRRDAEARGLVLETSLDPATGPVLGDAMRLQQVVGNLLSNAMKFTPAGGRITVDLRPDGAGACLRVSDTGIGIAPEVLPQVFDRFRQADTTSRRGHSGLGLGLAIVRHLVELHGGTVKADSGGRDAGSTFTVRLPIVSVPSSAGRVERAPAAGDEATRLDGVRVLVVDDHADGRELVSMVLERCGARTRTAGSAAEALKALAQEPVDVLLTDLGMPGADGYDLLRRVRARSGGDAVRAVALTAFAAADDR
ncbi:MAG TPA: ATP-binding protein, partial [Candidatus Limnocylindria bacterium]|nr:ATP-binding protein [Candidatus Limnocylindria bacterium]